MKLNVDVGETSRFSKTITETDITLFSAISGDFDPLHVDEEYARTTLFGRRIAHGIVVLGLLSAAESEMSRRIVARGDNGKPLSLGYDKIRFLKPVFIGDTLTAVYTISQVSAEKGRAVGKCEIFNQDKELVLVGEHIMKWVLK
jgi:3-hydroxybutyryl-CoA dehydratase